MASPNFVMSGEICRAICEFKRDHSECTLSEIREWVSETHRQRLCISTISEILDLNLSSPTTSANFYFGDSSDLRTETGAEEEDADEDEECMRLSEDSEADTEVEDEEVEEDDDDEEDEDEDEEMEDQDPALTLSDPDLLNCPVCTQPLTIPVYQCENGNVLCSSCCSKIDNNCPSWNIGQNRNNFVEKLLESLSAPCRNRKYGCEEMLKHYNKNEHEKTCPNSPCSCPVPNCHFKGSSPAGLYAHFSRSHIFATKVFSYNKFSPITLERDQKCLIFCGEDNSIFVLTRFSEVKGSAVNVVRIAPLHSDTLAYAIEAKCDETTIVLHSAIRNMPKWEDIHPERSFLLVPDYCTTSEGRLHLQLCIWSGSVQAIIPHKLVFLD